MSFHEALGLGRPRGRPAGAKNKRTKEREAAMQEAAARIRAAIDGAFDGDAHPFLIAVYKDPEMPHPTGRSEGGYWLREATPECERAKSSDQSIAE